MDLPLILAGPIVRRVEPRLVAVWVALSAPRSVRLQLWGGAERADTARAPDFEASATSLRAGEGLHIALVTLEIAEPAPALLPGRIYSYNLRLSGEGAPPADLASLGLLADRAGVEEDGRLIVKPHLALGYAAGLLPGFATPPDQLADLRIVHGSCRRPYANTPDALQWVDDLVRDAREDPLRRPQQLFLSGDQIYADDVALSMLEMLIHVADELTGEKEQLPTRWPMGPTAAGVRLWPADAAHFPAGLRTNVVLGDARLSTEDAESHLLSFGEFCAMYLFCWSNELWPERMPTLRGIFNVPDQIIEGAPDAAIWRLHLGLGLTDEERERFPHGGKALCNEEELRGITDAFTPTNAAAVLRGVCRHYRGSYLRQDKVLRDFRAGLPKVRRALANVATYMIFDDHEITDDWYLSPTWRDRVLTAPLGRTMVRNGLLAYALFQGWGNDPKRFQADLPGQAGKPGPHKQLLAHIPNLFPPGDDLPPHKATADAVDLLLGLDGKDPPVTWHYSVPGPRHQVVVLDCRTRRSFASRISGPGNVSAKALEEQLPPGPLPAGVEVLVVVSSLTVLGPPAIDALLGPFLYRLFDLLSHGNEAEMPGLNPDAIEAWPYDEAAFERLLRRVEPYRRVVVLSGDVHFAASSGMSYWKKGDALPARVAQFTSSGLKNLFRDEVRRAGQTLAFMQHVIRAEIGVERLGWDKTAADLLRLPAGERPPPALLERLGQSPALLPTAGWPAGTAEDPARPPDWAWRAEIVRDERPDAERPPPARPADVVPGSPGADAPAGIDGYRRAAVRHVKQLDNMNHDRQIVFASNLGLVRFERADGRLRAVHELFAAHRDEPLPQIYARHRVDLEILAGDPPERRDRPRIQP